MTEENKIICNGVDVRKCEFLYKEDEWLCDCVKSGGSGLCKDNATCNFKQLARKEQECEQLKQKNNELKHALQKIAKQRCLPCMEECTFKNGKCKDEISDYGQLCSVGIAKKVLEA